MSLAFIENNKIIQYPISSADLQKKFPNTSFPNTSFFLPLEGQNLEMYGVVTVENKQPPSFDSRTHRLEEGTPINNNGKWEQSWNLIELSEERKNQIENNKKESVRNERNIKLSASDWTQLPDSAVNKALWAQYRQELRDISKQSGFPWNVNWPEPPNNKENNIF